MFVQTVGSALSGTEASSVQKNDELGSEDFLHLLITQLQAQDPLNPMESSEFTAQLAQFNSLEQLTDINAGIEKLHTAHLTSNSYNYMNYIGKTVKYADNRIEKSDGESEDLRFETGADAESVFITIYDSYNNYVRTIEQKAQGAGEQVAVWDGRDDKGTEMGDGMYYYETAALDTANEAVPANAYRLDTVSGISFDRGTASLLSGEKIIPVSSVIRVMETPASGL
ncbi:MAG: flagellar hook assembly protein FlgD [Desulfococcaceae bacterium]|nr:flagellar hook assembly protein FlgD [Desulfococcaceae bacterium]